MQHKGEIIENAVRASGYSITKLAKAMGKSRRWVYQVFENPAVPIDYVLEIGRVIHYDFSDDINELKAYRLKMSNQFFNEGMARFSSPDEEAEYWKNKYLAVLEKYNDLLIKRDK